MKYVAILLLMLFSFSCSKNEPVMNEKNDENIENKSNELLKNSETSLEEVIPKYDYENIDIKSIEGMVQKYNYENVDINSVISLNAFGYYRYEKKEYSDAIIIFKNAIIVDKTYPYAHYNLACVLALQNENGLSIDNDELLYHVKYSIFLDNKYIQKIKEDQDLKSIWNENYFQYFLELLEDGIITVEDDEIFLTCNGENRYITKIAGYDIHIGPYESFPVFQLSTDKKHLVYVSLDKEELYVYLLTHYGLSIKVSNENVGKYNIFDCEILFNNNAKELLIYYDGKKLSLYQMPSLKEDVLIELPMGINDETIYDLRNVEFISVDELNFMGGSTFEYHFSGREY
jgi:hypothetical protein